jgi:nicotinamide-nucleotide amidase
MASGNDTVEAIGLFAREHGWTVAAAESLTCGRIVHELGSGSEASAWLAGGVVAYRPEVKRGLLGVREGPVITAACARQLATGVAALLGADAAIGVTGCGGPDPEEDQPPGTVFIAVSVDGRVVNSSHQLDGTPEEVIEGATRLALELLETTIRARHAAA